jgi:uncharacterized OB-fold protein
MRRGTGVSAGTDNPTNRTAALEALPVPLANADGERHWAAAKDGKLCLQRCVHCKTFRFPPGYLCRKCGSTEVEWVNASGRGAIYSFSVIRRGPSPEFSGIVPYILALVELEEGPRMMTHIIEESADEIAIGDRVQVVFEKRRGDIAIPQFKRVR